MEKEFDVLLERKEKKIFHLEGVMNDKSDFDGPLELLLFLIQENNANIYDIPIAIITDEYLKWIEEHETETNDLADFYNMAAKLIYIKTKLLLPQISEFDEEFEDPREELVERLIEYQKYKKLTDLLTLSTSENIRVERPDSTFTLPFEDSELFENISLDGLKDAFRSMLSNIPPSMIFNIYEEVSEAEKTALMLELLEVKRVITLKDLVVDFDNPLNIICSFMAILEAMKNQIITIYQAFPFAEILIKKREGDFEYENEEVIDEKKSLSSLELEAKDINVLSGESSLTLEEMATRLRESEERKEEEDDENEYEEVDLDE